MGKKKAPYKKTTLREYLDILSYLREKQRERERKNDPFKEDLEEIMKRVNQYVNGSVEELMDDVIRTCRKNMLKYNEQKITVVKEFIVKRLLEDVEEKFLADYLYIQKIKNGTHVISDKTAEDKKIWEFFKKNPDYLLSLSHEYKEGYFMATILIYYDEKRNKYTIDERYVRQFIYTKIVAMYSLLFLFDKEDLLDENKYNMTDDCWMPRLADPIEVMHSEESKEEEERKKEFANKLTKEKAELYLKAIQLIEDDKRTESQAFEIITSEESYNCEWGPEQLKKSFNKLKNEKYGGVIEQMKGFILSEGAKDECI